MGDDVCSMSSPVGMLPMICSDSVDVGSGMIETVGDAMITQEVVELNAKIMAGVCVSSLAVATGESCVSILKKSEVSAAKNALEVLGLGQSGWHLAVLGV